MLSAARTHLRAVGRTGTLTIYVLAAAACFATLTIADKASNSTPREPTLRTKPGPTTRNDDLGISPSEVTADPGAPANPGRALDRVIRRQAARARRRVRQPSAVSRARRNRVAGRAPAPQPSRGDRVPSQKAPPSRKRQPDVIEPAAHGD